MCEHLMHSYLDRKYEMSMGAHEAEPDGLDPREWEARGLRILCPAQFYGIHLLPTPRPHFSSFIIL